MARIEPFNYTILLPREGANPCIPLSLAASFEEPDLSASGAQGYAGEFLKTDDPLTLAALRKAECLREGEGVLVARHKQGDRASYGLYCRYPLKAVKELHEGAAGFPYTSQYRDLLMANKAYLDPLLLAIPEMKPEVTKALDKAGEEIATYHLGDEMELRISALTGAKEVRSLAKHFEPGLFGTRPSPMVLDGPVALAQEMIKRGEEYIFACLVPVGGGLASLDTREMLVEATGDKERSGDANVLPEGVRLRGYRFIDDIERAYVSVDWEEDLRIESQTADCCALLRRDRKELELVVGEPTRMPRGVAQLYIGGMFGGGKRTMLANGARAAKAFTGGEGAVAVWTPKYGKQDLTHALLARRPAIAARRAMVGLEPALPFGMVASLAKI
ncbi:MAG: hypothetical protein HUU29_06170 [Planctomycetaceae bacterium]|nr:hypothetical protein [Planctomycetaceae bacterium]